MTGKVVLVCSAICGLLTLFVSAKGVPHVGHFSVVLP